MNEKRVLFSEYEAIILLEGYLLCLNGVLSKTDAIKKVSNELRAIALNSEKMINDSYRNEAEISFQMREIESAYNGTSVFNSASKLFLEIVKLYNDDKRRYLDLLAEVKVKIARPYTYKQLFVSYLTYVSDYERDFHVSLMEDIGWYLKEKNVIQKDVFEIYEVEIIEQLLSFIKSNQAFGQTYKGRLAKISSSIRLYMSFLDYINPNFSFLDECEKYSDVLDNINDENIEFPTDNSCLEESVDLGSNLKLEYKEWLCSRYTNQDLIDEYLESINIADRLFSKHYMVDVSLWELKNPEFIDTVVEVLSKREFAAESEEAESVIYSLSLYQKYLEAIVGEQKTSINEKHSVKNSNLITADVQMRTVINALKTKYTSNPAKTLRQLISENSDINFNALSNWIKRKYDEPIGNYFIAIGIIGARPEVKDSRSCLEEVMIILRNKYSDVAAESLSQLTKDNPEISFTLFNSWTKSIYGITAKQYLVEQRIIKEKETIVSDIALKLHDIVSELKKRYSTSSANSLTQVLQENKDLSMSSINAWTRNQFNITAKQYLVEQGIIVEHEEEPKSISVKVEECTHILKSRYSDNKAISLTQVLRENPDLPVYSLNAWVQELYGDTAKSFLVREGIVVPDLPTINNSEVTYKSDLETTKVSAKSAGRIVGSDLERIIVDCISDARSTKIKTLAGMMLECSQILLFSNPEIVDFSLRVNKLRVALSGFLIPPHILSSYIDYIEYCSNGHKIEYAILYERSKHIIECLNKYSESAEIESICNVCCEGVNAHETIDSIVEEKTETCELSDDEEYQSSISQPYANDIGNSDYVLNDDEYSYLMSFLVEDFYFIDDIRKCLEERFGTGSYKIINKYNFSKLNFLMYSDYVIRDTYGSAYLYFVSVFTKNDTLDFSKDCEQYGKIPLARNVLSSLREKFDLIEYEDMKYISFNCFHSVYPSISKQDLVSFADDVKQFYLHSDARLKPFFTMASLRNLGFKHELDCVGLGEAFFVGILRHSKKIKCLRFCGGIVFCVNGDNVSNQDFIENLLCDLKKMNIYDFISMVKKDYGLEITKNRLINVIKESSMYYDSIMEKIYIDKNYYYDEI